MNQESFDKYLAEAAPKASTPTVLSLQLSLFPYFDIMGKTAALSSAWVARVSDTDGEHTVCVSYQLKDGEPEYAVWCGDKFVEGRNMTEAEATARCNEALTDIPGKDKLVLEMMKAYKKHGESARCNFWTTWRKDKVMCDHCNVVLARLRDTLPKFRQEMVDLYDNAASGSVATAPAADTMSFEELAFRVPVLFEGERGAGKTVAARSFARVNRYRKVEFGGHEGVEAPDMLGFLVPLNKDAMVWKDGAISEAFRAAQTEKTVLIIDELLRVPQRQLSVLLTALSPDEGYYVLRTGRVIGTVDGVATEETLTCPVENLCVVATTNVGAEYAVDEIDPALAERFVILRKDTTVPELKRILGLIAKEKKLPAAVVSKCVNFYTKMTESRARGLVKHAPTTRTLARSLELAKSEDDVKRAVKSQVLLWVARNSEGQPVPEQLTDVEKIIDRCFSGKK